MLKLNNDSYKYKYVDATYIAIITYSWIQYVNMPLFTSILYVVICRQTSK